MNYSAESQAIFEQMVEWRRHLHRHPELSFEEKETSQFIYDRLMEMGLDRVERMCDYCVVGVLHGTKGPGKCIAFRADMDALKVTEETGFPFASEVKGVAHACGHDSHVAILLATAKILAAHRDEFCGTVKFFFQNGEEWIPGGARGMVAAGCMDDPHVDAVFGCHIASRQKSGIVNLRAGSVCIGADRLDVRIHGKQGHAAHPESANDALYAACQYVCAIQQIVSRYTDPMKTQILSVGTLHAGEAVNIIAGEATLQVSVRAFDMATREKTKKKLFEIARGIESITDCVFELDYVDGYEPLENTPEIVDFLKTVCTEAFGVNSFVDEPFCSCDDFSYFMNADHTPGIYYLLYGGTETGEVYPNHHPKFSFREDAMRRGVEINLAITEKYLG
ncbi:MAG: M20 family metallopeptidase [Faecousia sp.]